MWVARDKDGTLNLFSEKPVRIDNDDDMWLSFVWHQENVHTCKRMRLDSSEFPYLKWEDEPIEVKLVPQSADVIEMPSEDEIESEVQDSAFFITSGHDRIYAVDGVGKILCNTTYEEIADKLRGMVEWIKSKIIK